MDHDELNIHVEYPKQVDSIIRAKKTLGVDAELYTTNLEEGDSPLEMHCGYSRFVFTLIDKEGSEIIFPKANIPAKDVAYIKTKTDIALHQLTINPRGTKTDTEEERSGLSTAYTQKLTLGKFSGRTPAAILLENKDLSNELASQRDFLMKNAEKYPANKVQAQAIDEALKIFNEGKLELINQEDSSNSTITIYDIPYKPLMSISDNEGNNLVYSIKIVCDPMKRYPFSIYISNCFAPVKKDDTGQLKVSMSKAKNKKESTLLVTEMEWYSMISRISKTLELFEMINFKKQFTLAEEHYQKNKDEYITKKSS